MITKEKIYEIATQLPYGAGREIAEKADVSEATVSLFLNARLNNLDSVSCHKIIKECVEYIKKDRLRKEKIESLLDDI